ncbi:hypothetical protein O6H91_04G093900 [Diphasiastrum complanatum]|nr:hypothetical protein O6H91_04G093900 [Diphasiastrum complanatum]
MNLHQILAFGMGGYSPHFHSQLVQGFQESVNLLKGTFSGSPQAGQASSQAFINALALLQQNIEHLQTLVQLIAQGGHFNAAAITQQQMKAAAGMATVISQLIAAAAGLLPQVHQQSPQSTFSFPVSQLGAEATSGMDVFQQNSSENSLAAALGVFVGNCAFSSHPVEERQRAIDIGCSVGETGLDRSLELAEHLLGTHRNSAAPGSSLGNHVGVDLGLNTCTDLAGNISSRRCNSALTIENHVMSNKSLEINGSLEDQDPGNGPRDDEDEDEAENLPLGSYELIELDAMEILAEHTHFCEICGKGFKRDANLRMHMRGHGDEYKTAAALAKPDKFSQDPSLRRPRRYSCPYQGCKRNKKHKKFLPLKTMLCVKNHYRRSHCPKMLTCNKCKVKSFSVVADLKTHEKHCGREKWQCSCGTTFSRKDKLLGHVALFVGHTPATRLFEIDSPGIGEKGKNEMGFGSRNLIANGSKRVSGCGANADFGGGNGSGQDSGVGSETKQENVPAMVLGGGDTSALAVKVGGTTLQWRDSNKLGSGLSLSESESSGAISGSQASTLSSFGQAGVSLLTGPSNVHGLFGSNYVQGPNGTS